MQLVSEHELMAEEVSEALGTFHDRLRELMEQSHGMSSSQTASIDQEPLQALLCPGPGAGLGDLL